MVSYCIALYRMVSYVIYGIQFHCTLLGCWLRCAGCFSQDAYILHSSWNVRFRYPANRFVDHFLFPTFLFTYVACNTSSWKDIKMLNLVTICINFIKTGFTKMPKNRLSPGEIIWKRDYLKKKNFIKTGFTKMSKNRLSPSLRRDYLKSREDADQTFAISINHCYCEDISINHCQLLLWRYFHKPFLLWRYFHRPLLLWRYIRYNFHKPLLLRRYIRYIVIVKIFP